MNGSYVRFRGFLAKSGHSAYDPIADIDFFARCGFVIENIWHLRGRTKLPQDAPDAIIFERLEAFLAKQHKPIVSQTNLSIAFNSPLWEDWLTPNWLALVIYDKGTFWIDVGLEGRSLRYDLRSWHGFLFCLAGALMFFAFAGAFGGVAEGIEAALFCFAWLYGGNMALAWARIPLAIKRAVNVSYPPSKQTYKRG